VIELPLVSYDEYRHLMRLLGAPGDIGPRSLGMGLTGAGVMNLRERFAVAEPERLGNAPLASHRGYE
jgi:hypothetical protein